MSGESEPRTGRPRFKPRGSLPVSNGPERSGQFRAHLDNLLTMAKQVQELRTSLARSLGVSEPQYRLVWAIAELQGAEGVTVTSVARRLRVTGAFITTEVAKLCKLGLVSKKSNPGDGRSVLLRLKPKGERALNSVAVRAQRINDSYFRRITAAEFEELSRIVAKLIVNGAETLTLIHASTSLPPGPIGLPDRGSQVLRPGRRIEQPFQRSVANKPGRSLKERKNV
jgi:DNA-binding MarR family transcriptional regulator